MMERNLERLKQSTSDVDAAYAFFVAAAHLPERMRDEYYKRKITKKYPLLGICNELAIGAKHFEQTWSKTVHLQNTSAERFTEKGYDAPGYDKVFLHVYLEPSTSQKLGLNDPYVEAVELAERVLDFWRNKGGF